MVTTEGSPRGNAAATTKIVVPGAHSMVALLGSSDELLRLIERAFTCDIHVRLNEKIDPYLRPLYDALHDMVDPDSIPRLMASGTIEVAALGYLRGRTLNDSFIVLDEAQNTTLEQMKMFLTRLGFGSKMVVTGDVTQIDLPTTTKSGLKVVQEILDGIEDVHFSRLTSQDVVRHRLVTDIVDAYAKWDAENSAAQTGPRPANSRRRAGR